MKKMRQGAGVAFTVAAAAICGLPADGVELPSRKELAAAMARVNEYQRAHPVMEPNDRNWERGAWYTGVMAAWKATRDERYLKQAVEWGERHNWMTGTEPNGANRLFCSETWIEVYFEKKDKAMIQPTVDWLATPDPYSPAGQKRWYLEAKTRSYVDSLYGAAAFAMLAKATGRREYLDQMQAFFDDVTGELWDEESGLYYRDKRYIGQRTANAKKVFWSRGNGWVFAGIARILEYLPKGDARREGYEKIFRRMAVELLKRQPADGLWRASLDDAAAEPNPETSGTGFFCYGMAWGVNRGLLERGKYLPAIERAMSGLMRSVGADGRVEWGQQVDHRPNPAARESTHEYVTGTFLLASSEVYNMKR